MDDVFIKRLFSNFHDKRKLSLIKFGLISVFCDGGNIAFILFVSVLLHQFLKTAVYVIVISVLRPHTGGWHAPTKRLCTVTYFLFYCSYLGLTSISLNSKTCIFVVVLCGCYMIAVSPIEHPYNPLSINERRINKNYVVIYVLLIVLSVFVSNNLLYINCVAISFLINTINMALLRYNS